MTDFRNNRELRRIDFEMKMYRLDRDINSILDDLENCEDKETIKKHIERISLLLEQYNELKLCGIETITVDVQFLRYINGLLFDKYFELLVVSLLGL